jgi:thiol-disulfide isomerase/thioredoxin
MKAPKENQSRVVVSISRRESGEEEWRDYPKLSFLNIPQQGQNTVSLLVEEFAVGDEIQVHFLIECLFDERTLERLARFQVGSDPSGLKIASYVSLGPHEIGATVEAVESHFRLRMQVSSQIHSVREALRLEGLNNHSLPSSLLGRTGFNEVLPWGVDLPNAIRSNEDLHIEGRVTVLDFWAVWCGPCLATMPKFTELSEQYAQEKLQVISVCSTERQEDFHGVERVAARYQHLFALGTSRMLASYEIRSFPTLVVLDKHGVVRWVGSGARAMPSREFLDQLLKE